MLLLGWVAFYFQYYGVTCLLTLSAFLGWVSHQISIAQFKTQILDAIEAQIESENLAAAPVERRGPADTAGFSAPIPAYIPRTHREQFVNSMTATTPPRPLRASAAPPQQAAMA